MVGAKYKVKEIITKKFFGLKFSLFDNKQLFSWLNFCVKNDKQQIVFGYSLTILPKFKNIPQLYYLSDEFDIFLADGRGMYLLYKFFGVPLKSDLSLPLFVNKLLEEGNKNKYSILLLGADKETNLLATKIIREKYSNLVVYDGIDGYFSQNEEQKIVDRINFYNPDVLLIGISSPKKEEFAIKWKNKLNSKIIVPCGGVIDILAGKKKYVPIFFKKLGVSWLYRFIQEPKRLFKPVLLNGLSILFFLIPKMIFQIIILKKEFSIPKYYIKNKR